MKLFLSFPLADWEWAAELAETLRESGFVVLRWDERSIRSR